MLKKSSTMERLRKHKNGNKDIWLKKKAKGLSGQTNTLYVLKRSKVSLHFYLSKFSCIRVLKKVIKSEILKTIDTR